MKFDFHCHTHLSDGTQTLRWLAERAVATGVTHLAITDHDHLTPIEGCDDLEVALIPELRFQASGRIARSTSLDYLSTKQILS